MVVSAADAFETFDEKVAPPTQEAIETQRRRQMQILAEIRRALGESRLVHHRTA